MASSPACGMPEQGQRWAPRAARAAARPSTDEGQWEGVTEPGTSPAFTPWSSSSPQSSWPLARAQPSSLPLGEPAGSQAALTTLGGSLCPGRYLTFSCSVLMMSVSRRPPTSSSSTHMLTRLSKLLSRAALVPTILAMAEPLRGQREAVAVGTGEPRAAQVTL